MGWLHYEVSDKIKIKSFVSAFEKTAEGGFSFEGECHDFWEMMYVAEGKVMVSADERVFELSENEIIFHKPMELHKFHIERGEQAKFFVMSFDLTGDSVFRLENLSIKLSHRQNVLLFNIISLLKEHYKKDRIDFCPYIDLSDSNTIYLQQLAISTELFLLSAVDSAREVTASDSADALVFRNAVNIMSSFIEEWISVPEIAKRCNVSVSYLKKIFTKHSGLGVHKYFLKMKIIYASELLREGNTVTEVSDILNFSSQNYFSMVFRREMGVPPLWYKGRTF